MNEYSFFSRQKDGYPWLLEKDPFNQYCLFGTQSMRVGILDFFDSLATFSRVEASIQQSLYELIKVHMPENGMAISALERALVLEARARIKSLMSGDPLMTK
jgi:hypothetical protein